MISTWVVQRTGQMWKFHLGTFAHTVGVVLVFWGAFDGLKTGNYTIFLLGLAVGLVAATFCSATIRCPKCGAHWYWKELRTFQKGWARRVMRQPKCPVCGYGGGENDA